MFTQCPKCETIFKLSAEVLRAAAGEVRCGRCGEIFNALSSLAEEPRAFSKGESPREQEARADNILQFAPLDPPPQHVLDEEIEFSGSPGTQIAHLEIQGGLEDLPPWAIESEDDLEYGDETQNDASMEFTLPPGELDRIFIEARPRPVPRPPGSTRIDVEEIEPARPEDIRHDLSEQLIDSAAATYVPEGMEALEDTAENTLRSDSDSPVESTPLTESTPHAAHSSRSVPAPHPELRIAVGLPEEPPPLEPVTPDSHWLGEDAQPQPHKSLWLGAAALLLVLLAGQIAHQNREALAQAAGIGGAVRSVYAAIGQPIPLQTNLAGFEVRQWGVTGDANANGTLRVRASVINTSEQPQAYPLLRLTLADRFGTRIGSRDFLPSEYLKRTPTRPLDPRERADAIIEIMDPGKTAEGFEIDVCARSANGRVLCANDANARDKQ